MEKLSTPSSSSSSSSTLNASPSPSSSSTQRIRRITSPSITTTTTTKPGPIKAVKQFPYFRPNSPTTTTTRNNGRKKEGPAVSSPSSPTSSSSAESGPGHGHRIWGTGWSQPTTITTADHHHWGERKSPNSSSSSPIIKVERPKAVRLSPASSSSSSRAPSIEIQAYLHGQWPRDTSSIHHHHHHSGTLGDGHSFVQDQSTQTSEDWDVTANTSAEKRPKKGHRRSASLGQQEQLQLIRQRLQKTKEQTESSKARQSPVPANHSALPPALSPFTQPKSIPHNIPKPSMPRYQRNSVEGLNTEIEKLVLKSICLTEDEDKAHSHDIPDGHRAPLPEQQHQHHQQLRGGGGGSGAAVIGLSGASLPSNMTTSTRSLYTQTASESVEISSASSSNEESQSGGSSNSSSAAGSRSQSVSPVMPIIPAGHMETSRPSSQTDTRGDSVHSSKETTDKGEHDLPVIASPEPKFVSSPKPNMSYSFAREPPDGCERIRATCVETAKKTPSIKEPLLFCSPKNNAYVLKPSVTSAFNPLYKSLISQTPELALRGGPAAAVVTSTGQTQASIEGQ